MRSPLDNAIKACGSLTKLAKALDVSPQVVVNWKRRGVPAGRVLDIERATIDQRTGRPRVLRNDLRPDLYPEDVAI